MEVVAFVGPSGTGKSHRAIGVAFANKCDAIIDDGLLIKGTKILAGTSAKNEDNRVQAVKRAIFTDAEHAKVVREALHNPDNGIQRLLIIATSDKMIDKIVAKLEAPKPIKTVYIHDIATKEEIKKARYSRLHDGKHIVPVPSVELKPHFTGYFADLPYNIFSKDRKKANASDRSIVRPAFSFYGKLLVADDAIDDIVKIVAKETDGVADLTKARLRRRSDSSKGLVIRIEVILYYGEKIQLITKRLQAHIKQKVEYMTAMTVKNVDVSVRSLQVRKKA
ncbi:MAG: Asp23/Gls24 family envelope stress response protein [Phascolarctobacterium sp.]|nr:Asp23/Gls24 family envelope stress response protein [Phascolarctobacterium sp.]